MGIITAIKYQRYKCVTAITEDIKFKNKKIALQLLIPRYNGCYVRVPVPLPQPGISLVNAKDIMKYVSSHTPNTYTIACTHTKRGRHALIYSLIHLFIDRFIPP